MAGGTRLAIVLVLGASLIALPGAGTAQASDCGLVVPQDDAHSQRDAGATPEEAVPLEEEAIYPASISYPHGPVLDAEDWFTAAWEGQQDRRVMVNVSTRAQGLGYLLGDGLPAPHLALEAYAPGADTPTHTGEIGEDGVVRLDFTTEEPGIWSFRVSLPSSAGTADCPASQSLDAPSDLQTYNLYWGCHPHCIVTE